MEKAKSLPVGRLFCVRTGPSFGSLSLVVVSSLARCSLSFWLVFGSSLASCPSLNYFEIKWIDKLYFDFI
jgi:hypothetical protein